MNVIFIALKCGCCKCGQLCSRNKGKHKFKSVVNDDKFETEDHPVEMEKIEETH